MMKNGAQASATMLRFLFASFREVVLGVVLSPKQPWIVISRKQYLSCDVNISCHQMLMYSFSVSLDILD